MYKHILAATDFSDLGDRALQKASELAIQLGAKLTFVHVMVSEDSASPMYAQHEVRAHVKKLGERMPQHHDVQVELEVRVGDAPTEILAAAEAHDADLIVIATRGERGFAEWLLGSTAERVVRNARRDVLIVT
ncbi:universal stress protein [Sandaracinus amylolyticus]|uniref:universal stress protein n=1 Tax=Sandaracinus amylolyticus TaxID=927083 RepID=UPI001F192970|nr:universal stress protein [Sandaracinus amylolyticus]UJR83069.1 Hypothetical protein I5071_51350 [Sandaracinus amylolyticus]